MPEELFEGSAEASTTNGATKKTPHIRSSPYPAFTIESSNAFTAQIDKAYGSSGYISKDDISKTLNLSGGGFLTKLSSAVQYGLLEVKQNQGYKPTELFNKIKKPLETENVRDFHIECFNNPKLYKTLISTYRDKQIPSESGLINLLDRNYGVKGGAAIIATKIFLKNATSLNLLGEDGILRMGEYIPFVETPKITDKDEREPIQEPTVYLTVQEKNPPSHNNHNSNPAKARTIPVFLQGENREATVILPFDFNDDDLKRIVKIMTAYIA